MISTLNTEPEYLAVTMVNTVKITDADTGEVILDKKNAVHPQNMSRIIARALSRESNSYIYRIAFGNGGTVTDPTGHLIFNPTNDGSNGSWESRLYNETYSEIVDDTDINFGTDPGSAEAGNIRGGGGAVPSDDPSGGGVRSVEVGTKSNVVISMFINRGEPTGQFLTNSDFYGIVSNDRFVFDEIGLYSPGKPAAATNGESSVDIGNMLSSSISLLAVSTAYVIKLTVDGTHYLSTITTPAGGSGSGGAITYGDICEGINSGAWVTSGDDISTVSYVFITDRSGGTYPSIIGKESYGFLTFQSLSSGAASTVALSCEVVSGTSMLKIIASNNCNNVDVNKTTGGTAGVLNDAIDPTQERERLLTHMVFPPITKTGDKAINIVYTLTISVARTTDSRTTQNTTFTGY